MVRSVSRTSTVALWRQIADSLEKEITSARLAVGARLPTETQLAECYGVNRHTLRRALDELGRKGLVSASPRRGRFVSQPRIPYLVGQKVWFVENIIRAGREPGCRMLSETMTKAPREVAQWLRIAPAAQVVELKRIRLANEVPICLAITWFPADRFDRMAQIYEHVGSLNKAFARFGIKTCRRKRSRIGSDVATREENDLLALQPGDLILQLDGLDVDHHDEPLAVTQTRFAAARVELVFDY